MDDILDVLQLGCAVKLDKFQAVRLGTCFKSLEDKNKAVEQLAAHRMQSINELIAEKETLQAVNEQLAHELNMHRPHTDKLADLAAYCVQRGIGQVGQNAHEAIMAHCDALAAQVEALLHGGDWLVSMVTRLAEERIEHNLADHLEIRLKETAELFEQESPQQLLAEIRAEAGRAGFLECIRFIRNAIDPNADHADIYSDKVLREG